MKQFIAQHRKSIMWQALQSGGVLSLCIYAIIRFTFYEFPMSWTEEAIFFLKTYFISCFLIATATGGSAWMYRSLIRMKLYKK